MALTREEWVAMWNTVKRMEYLVLELRNSDRKSKLLNELFSMKAHIQSVIGQMER